MVCSELRSASYWAILIEKNGMFKSYVKKKNYACSANDQVVICQEREYKGMFAKWELSLNTILF